ncbi:hypothetical protein AK830_g11793 [Neonectria ditissima]|uniref:Uncharacterized protein n=1 Tax=Neonectria ditissima TaxID=78410 RepID=A0A0P7AC56_9HYPO|nr:hypothetical protein AK830_g11793 [Neonectria ditissima]
MEEDSVHQDSPLNQDDGLREEQSVRGDSPLNEFIAPGSKAPLRLSQIHIEDYGSHGGDGKGDLMEQDSVHDSDRNEDDGLGGDDQGGLAKISSDSRNGIQPRTEAQTQQPDVLASLLPGSELKPGRFHFDVAPLPPQPETETCHSLHDAQTPERPHV